MVTRARCGYSRLRCPRPNATKPHPARKINRPAPSLDGGRYSPKRCVGDTVKVTADIFRDGHEIMRAVIRYKAPGGRRWLEEPMHAVDAHINGVRWEGEFTVTTPGSWQFSIEAWNDLFATWRARDAAQDRRRPARPDGRAVGGRGAARADRREDQGRHRPRDARGRGRDAARHRAARVVAPRDGAEPRGRRRRGARGRAPRGRVAGEAAAARGRSRAGAVQHLVRALPALVGRSEGRRGADPGDRRARLRRPLLPSDPPDRPQEPQGPQQHAGRRPRRPGRPVRDRRRRGRARRRPPGARHDRRRALAVRHGARPRHGRGARPRAQRLRRPPVADRAPRVVPAAPRRHDQVRREPAQEVPGHLQLQLGHAGLEGAVGGVASDRPVLGRRRHQGVPRRQPAHEAVPVLGVADQGGPRRRPRRDLPGGGVHAAGRDARAGQARLHAVLHLLHVEELALRADRVRQRAGLDRGGASTSGPTSSRSRRTSCTPTSSTAGRPRSSPGSSWPRR